MNPHVPKKFEGFEATMKMGLTALQIEQVESVPGVKITRLEAHEIFNDSDTNEVHDCGNCLSYRPGTIVCRCDECNDDYIAWDPIPKNPI